MFPRISGSCLLGCGLLLVISVQAAFAQESARPVISPFVTLAKLAGALLIVLCIFWLFARVMRSVQSYQTAGTEHGLKVVSALSVGQRERVVVVQAGDEQLVLGVTGTQINTLHVLDKPLNKSMGTESGDDFRSKLTAALKNRVNTQ